MNQDRESGAAGRAYGLRMGRVLAALMGAEKLSEHSNEVIWNGRRAALKACAPRNDTFGVTAVMLARLDDIMAGFENEKGDVEVWRMSAEISGPQCDQVRVLRPEEPTHAWSGSPR